MAVKIRLKRMGKIRAPFYRVVVADSRKKRDGAVIEEIGLYHPTEEPSVIEIASERAQYWLGVGAQPSEQVAALGIARITMGIPMYALFLWLGWMITRPEGRPAAGYSS